MSVRQLAGSPEVAASGAGLHQLVARLYPLARSITGDGVRDTLRILGELAPIEVHEVPTGTPALDWTVPREWNVADAYIADETGERIVDFKQSNLHVLGYSTPVHVRLPLAELREHLYTSADHPDAVPYRTSYYAERWGFCLSQRQLDGLPDAEYEARIDSTLEPGSLTYGECVVPGTGDDEVLVWTHTCHPSLANDNCSGMAVAATLAALLSGVDHRLTYRFLFGPGQIGSITWLSRNEDRLDRVVAGLVLSNMGDRGAMTYKRSRRGDTTVDRAATHVVGSAEPAGAVVDFSPFGYDERQFCSPGFDLPVGLLSRSPWGSYPEYHTSADDLTLVTPESLVDSLAVCLRILSVLEDDAVYVNRSPKGEPQLGRRGLYGSLGGAYDSRRRETALLWVLNQSDGTHSLLDVAERSGIPFVELADAADALVDAELLERR
jgi:aminopeptidase-like protein